MSIPKVQKKGRNSSNMYLVNDTANLIKFLKPGPGCSKAD